MNFLIPVSGSRASLAAVRHAAAALREGRGEVTLVNVQPTLPSYVARFTSRASRDALRAERSASALAEARAILDAAGVRYSTVAAQGQVAPAVADVAHRTHADEIVLGATRRAGWWQALFSPVPRIIDLADVPVSVIGEGRSGAFERYGVPACVGLGLTALAIATE
jgi:nucleotide-binding universal stress UspA family protein